MFLIIIIIVNICFYYFINLLNSTWKIENCIGFYFLNLFVLFCFIIFFSFKIVSVYCCCCYNFYLLSFHFNSIAKKNKKKEREKFLCKSLHDLMNRIFTHWLLWKIHFFSFCFVTFYFFFSINIYKILFLPFKKKTCFFSIWNGRKIWNDCEDFVWV